MGVFAVDFASVIFKNITFVSEVESIGCIIINLSTFQEHGCCLNLPSGLLPYQLFEELPSERIRKRWRQTLFDRFNICNIKRSTHLIFYFSLDLQELYGGTLCFFWSLVVSWIR